jgi:hypothetical protein
MVGWPYASQHVYLISLILRGRAQGKVSPCVAVSLSLEGFEVEYASLLLL